MKAACMVWAVCMARWEHWSPRGREYARALSIRATQVLLNTAKAKIQQATYKKFSQGQCAAQEFSVRHLFKTTSRHGWAISMATSRRAGQATQMSMIPMKSAI